MKSKKKLLKKSRLYAIIDKEISGQKALNKIADQLKESEADIIQLRDKTGERQALIKTACRLERLFRDSGKIFIVNDYLDIAKIAGCDGVHLGQGDTSVGIARKILGKEKIIGVSCHSLRQALDAQKDGADYVSIGPIFPTPLKAGCKTVGTSLIRTINKRIKIPYFAIGGIDLNNLSDTINSGTKRLAVCRALIRSRNIKERVKRFSDALKLI